jgi:glycosyltransferase involved in cell wall biosynthesis
MNKGLEQKGNIVFINQVTGYLMKDLVNTFAEKYYKVALIAGSVSKAGDALNTKVRISKITRYKKKSKIYRILSWLSATIQAIILVNIKYRGFHIFITSNPPTLAFLPLFCKNRYSVLIYDIYPDGLIAGGFINESSWINKIWKMQNKRFLSVASHIYTLTDGMAETLSKYVDIERIIVIPPWSLFKSDNKVDKKNNKFIKQHNLDGYFMVMYSGNIGLGHNVESIVEVAKTLKGQKDIRFVIIGDGWNKQSVEKLIVYYQLNNCLVLPFQSPEMFQHSLPAADIGVVSIAREGAKLCAPSKIYNLINLGIPLLAITEESSDLANLIQKHDIGTSFRFDQIKEMAEFILTVKNDRTYLTTYKSNLNECAGIFTSENAIKYLNNFSL